MGGAAAELAVTPAPDGGLQVSNEQFSILVAPASNLAGDPPGTAPGTQPGGGGQDGSDHDHGDDTGLPVDAEATLSLQRGQAAAVQVAGFAPDSLIRLWLLSEPVLLGELHTDHLGTLDALTERIPDEVSACAHTLHAEGFLPGGEPVAVSIGVWVDADPYPFDDVTDTDTHRRAIACLADMGVTQGVRTHAFDPAGLLTRGQTASMFARWFALQPTGPATHLDVIGTTHEAGIAALVEAGIAHGYDADRFGPGQPITRGQFASMFAALLELPTVTTAAGFTDSSPAHDPAIGALTASGAILGFDDNTFRPHEPITRAQTASIIVREATNRR